MKPRKPLERKTPLPRQAEPLRRTPIKSGRERRGPTKPRKSSSSTDVPAKVRAAVLARDDHTCQRCGRYLVHQPYSLQHRRPRGMGGAADPHTMANLVVLCGTATTGCHGDVESHRSRATRDGWLVPAGVSPEEWPVWRATHQWEQPGVGWVECEPHPRQVEGAA